MASKRLPAVLIALGFVNLVPAPLAAFLEKRLRAEMVVMGGPIVQAAIALTITLVAVYPAYAGAGAVYVAIMIFTHTFAFGLLSRLDPSGRALAATPAMLMVGAAIGPILGGTLVKFFRLSAPSAWPSDRRDTGGCFLPPGPAATVGGGASCRPRDKSEQEHVTAQNRRPVGFP